MAACSSASTVKAVVAGHICLDIFPSFEECGRGAGRLFTPGTLASVGPALLSTGGAVANTGLALHRLGIPVFLVGKIGEDLFGRAILEGIRSHDSGLTRGMIVSKTEHTSYTIVISPPGKDRTFLHHTGANDALGADDVALASLSGARLFHFGYPPIMKRMVENGGAELETLFRRVKDQGLATSLDMCEVDPDSGAEAVDWPALLERVLPLVDAFLPSLPEILFMLECKQIEGIPVEYVNADVLRSLAEKIIGWGTPIVGLKLGEEGMYLRTGREPPLLANGAEWSDRELLAPCFKVAVQGTTGSGDCTIAGFLAGLLEGRSPEDTITEAVAVGACSVEQMDAVTGVPARAEIRQRIRAGWERRPVTIDLPGWRWNENTAIWSGPQDLLSRP